MTGLSRLTSMALTIIKCGGSLLDLSDLVQRLLALVDRESLQPAVVVVGGGAAVDLVRNWDQKHCLSAEESHELAIHAMALNARMLISLHSRLCAVTSVDQVAGLPSQAVAVLIPDVAIQQLEIGNAPLPRSWHVTSDSIAAWLATIYDARLLLLKSADMPESLISPRAVDLAAVGLVDPGFPQLASELTNIEWCNLRCHRASIRRIEIP